MFYIDAPTIPEGMTIEQYQRERPHEANRLLALLRRARREAPTMESCDELRVPGAPWLRIGSTRHSG